MNKRFWLIINPARYPHIARQLKGIVKYIPRSTVRESRSEEHFRELIRDFIASGDSYLLIWGGDGTANIALNCLMKADKKRRDKIAVGFLRGGSGNGIQDSYEVPKNLRAQIRTYLESMENRRTQRVDLLKISFDEEVLYGQLFGTGLDAKALNARNSITQSGKKNHPRPGFIPYIIPAIKTVYRGARLQEEPLLLTLNQGRFAFRGTRTNAEFPFKEYALESRAPLLEVGVRPYYGWYYKICPDVVCNNGLMDAYLFNLTSPWKVLFSLFSLWNGHYHRINKRYAKKGLPLIEHYKIRKMTIHPQRGRLFHIDGELHRSDGEVTLKVKNQTLRFLVPESFHQKFHPLHEWDEKIV
ncbi:MAG: sphingosine kinase [Spirochaetales bacterium]|nr:sphingosine kinase [Spirochaetales bacterium]